MPSYNPAIDEEDEEDLGVDDTQAEEEAAPLDDREQQIRDYVASKYQDHGEPVEAVTPATPAQAMPQKEDILKAQLAAAQDMSGVNQAQSNLKDTTNRSEWGQAISNFLAPQYAPTAERFYGGMRDNAKEQVNEAVRRRALEQQNLALGQEEKKFRHENAVLDPDSDASKAIRNTYRQMFPDVVGKIDNFDLLSGADVEKYLSKPLEMKNAADTRSSIAKENAEARRQQQRYMDQSRADAKSAKEEEEINKERISFSDKLDSARTILGKETVKLNTAAHGLALLDKPASELTPIEINEIGGVLATQVTGGSPAMQTLHEMTPQTAKQDMAKALSYISGKPVKADSAEYVNLMKSMLKRQVDTSKSIIQENLGVKMAAHPRLFEGKSRDSTVAMLNKMGVSLDDKNEIAAYEPAYAKLKNDAERPDVPSGTAYAGTPTEKMIPFTAPNGETRMIPESRKSYYENKAKQQPQR